jgi:hypothetical protein
VKAELFDALGFAGRKDNYKTAKEIISRYPEILNQSIKEGVR